MDKVYDKAWKLIASQERWTRGAMGRYVDGSYCDPTDPKAVKWCLAGALFKTYGRAVGYDMMVDLNHSINSMISHWNDLPIRKHSEVVEFLKERDL